MSNESTRIATALEKQNQHLQQLVKTLEGATSLLFSMLTAEQKQEHGERQTKAAVARLEKSVGGK